MAWGATGDPVDVAIFGGADGAMTEAAALAGLRVLTRQGWQGAAPAPGALTVVDLGGVADLDAAADLDRLLAGADIVACDLDQLDLVADAVLLSDTQLLCAPTMAERVTALVIAASDAAAPAGVREGPADDAAARLQRFGAEVGRIATLLSRLAGEQGAVDEHRATFDPGPPAAAPAHPIDPQAIRLAIRARRLRAQAFGDGLFEDPAWDMLLDLFAAELEGARVSVSSLCIAAHVAPTTALRWIGRLIALGLFERRPDPRDRRRAFIALSPRGSAAMRAHVAALARAGLALG